MAQAAKKLPPQAPVQRLGAPPRGATQAQKIAWVQTWAKSLTNPNRSMTDEFNEEREREREAGR